MPLWKHEIPGLPLVSFETSEIPVPHFFFVITESHVHLQPVNCRLMLRFSASPRLFSILWTFLLLPLTRAIRLTPFNSSKTRVKPSQSKTRSNTSLRRATKSDIRLIVERMVVLGVYMHPPSQSLPSITSRLSILSTLVSAWTTVPTLRQLMGSLLNTSLKRSKNSLSIVL